MERSLPEYVYVPDKGYEIDNNTKNTFIHFQKAANYKACKDDFFVNYEVAKQESLRVPCVATIKKKSKKTKNEVDVKTDVNYEVDEDYDNSLIQYLKNYMKTNICLLQSGGTNSKMYFAAGFYMYCNLMHHAHKQSYLHPLFRNVRRKDEFLKVHEIWRSVVSKENDVWFNCGHLTRSGNKFYRAKNRNVSFNNIHFL